MTDSHDNQDASPSLNALFGENLPADRPAPIIERALLDLGFAVRHQNTRQVKTNNGVSTIHAFSLLGISKDAPWFSLWGSANLNSQLRKAKPGAVLYLRYAGQVLNDDGTPGAHQWKVKPSTAAPAAISAYLSGSSIRARVDDLTTAIAAALMADRERRALRRTDVIGWHDDDDDPPPF